MNSLFDLQLPAGTVVGNMSAATRGAEAVPAAALAAALPTQLTFIQAGTGAVSRTMQNKMRDFVSVFDFGAVGDGSTDDTTAFNNAMAASFFVFVPNPSVGYKITSKLTVPTSTTLYGAGKHTCKLLHAFNGDFMELGSQAGLRDLYIEGQGGSFTGKGVGMTIGGNGKQLIRSCKIINFNDLCINFGDVNAASQFSGEDIETWQTNGTSGSGKFAIGMADAAQLSATPRKFSKIETAGFCSFSFGGCNDIFISDSFLADLAFSSNSRGVHITSSRLANQTAMTMSGANHTIVNCDIVAVITLSSGTTACVLGPNSWNTSPYVTDSSGSSSNSITIPVVNYTPTFASANGDASLGNGTISGTYTQIGQVINYAIDFTAGSTTAFGTGGLRFGLPVARVNSNVLELVNWIINHSAALWTAIGQIPGAVQYCTGIYTSAATTTSGGAVDATHPVAFANTDNVRISGSYYR